MAMSRYPLRGERPDRLRRRRERPRSRDFRRRFRAAGLIAPAHQPLFAAANARTSAPAVFIALPFIVSFSRDRSNRAAMFPKTIAIVGQRITSS